MKKENVLCIARHELCRVLPVGLPDNRPVRWGDIRSIAALCRLGKPSFRVGVRPEVETDPGRLQLATYARIFLDGDVLAYRRKPSSDAESRLHGLHSVGIGGHVAYPEGFDEMAFFHPQMLYNYLMQEAQRELIEEVSPLWNNVVCMAPVGLIYSEEDAVSRHHLGIVFDLHIDSLEAVQRMPDGSKPAWNNLLSPEDIAAAMDPGPSASVARLESWSRLVSRCFPPRSTW